MEKYAYRDLNWEKFPPHVSQDQGELVLPYYLHTDSLLTVRWKDIDSIVLYDTRWGNVRLSVFGRAVAYKKCTGGLSCKASYYNSFYSAVDTVAKLEIPLDLYTSKKNPVLTKKIQQRFGKAFAHWNNITFRENIRVITYGTVAYDRKEKAILLPPVNMEKSKKQELKAAVLKKTQQLMIAPMNTGHIFTVASFTVYISRKGKLIAPVYKIEGTMFSKELTGDLNKLKAGDFVTIDYLKVNGPDGIRSIDGISIRVR